MSISSVVIGNELIGAVLPGEEQGSSLKINRQIALVSRCEEGVMDTDLERKQERKNWSACMSMQAGRERGRERERERERVRERERKEERARGPKG